MDGHLARMELPLYSVGGIFGARTMKIYGKVKGQPLVIMIDSGMSHNNLANSIGNFEI